MGVMNFKYRKNSYLYSCFFCIETLGLFRILVRGKYKSTINSNRRLRKMKDLEAFKVFAPGYNKGDIMIAYL